MLKQDIFYMEHIPEYIGNKQLQDLVVRYKNGEQDLKEEILTQNIRLIFTIVKKFSNCGIDSEELCQNGFFGLYKALNSYQLGKNVKFDTYAAVCIENEILMTLRKEKKHSNNVSTDFTISENNDGDKLLMEDVLISDGKEGIDIVLDEDEKNHLEIALRQLSKRDEMMLKLSFGFINDKCYTQNKLGDLFSNSQSLCSRIIKNGIKQLKNILEKDWAIDDLKETVTLENYLDSIVKNDRDFERIIENFSNRDVLIIAFGLGYFNNHYFLFEDIANYFNLSLEEVETIVFQGVKTLCMNEKQKKK